MIGRKNLRAITLVTRENEKVRVRVKERERERERRKCVIFQPEYIRHAS